MTPQSLSQMLSMSLFKLRVPMQIMKLPGNHKAEKFARKQPTKKGKRSCDSGHKTPNIEIPDRLSRRTARGCGAMTKRRSRGLLKAIDRDAVSHWRSREIWGGGDVCTPFLKSRCDLPLTLIFLALKSDSTPCSTPWILTYWIIVIFVVSILRRVMFTLDGLLPQTSVSSPSKAYFQRKIDVGAPFKPPLMPRAVAFTGHASGRSLEMKSQAFI